MLQFLSTVSKTETMRLTGKYPQCQRRLFVTVRHFKIGLNLKISCFITPQFGVENSQIRADTHVDYLEIKVSLTKSRLQFLTLFWQNQSSTSLLLFIFILVFHSVMEETTDDRILF